MAIVADFVADLKRGNKGKGTIDGYRRCVTKFLNFIKPKNYSQITHKEIGNFYTMLREEEELAETSVNFYHHSIKSFYNYLLDESLIDKNPSIVAGRRYIRGYKKDSAENPKMIVTTEQARSLIKFHSNPMYRTILMLYFKTGMRREELVTLKTTSINIKEKTLTVNKRHRKRSNRTALYDDEMARQLKKWLDYRVAMAKPDTDALFVNVRGGPISNNLVQMIVHEAAVGCGLYDANSPEDKDRFSTHSTRYWFTNTLLHNGMNLMYVKILRGDSLKKEIAWAYAKATPEDLRASYDRYMPIFGI